MKFPALCIAAAALLFASPAPGLPGAGPSGGYGMAYNHNHGTGGQILREPQNVQNALVLLHAEALSLQAQDGGTLTDDHRKYLQTKLNGILRERPVRRAL